MKPRRQREVPFKSSAGILVYRRSQSELQFLLAHPGGPFWAKKDLGAWSIPKGEIALEEDPLAAARREALEETGLAASGPFIDLGEIVQAGGKHVIAWAFESDFDCSKLVSNTFSIEWPPRSGKQASFPEVDRVAWFSLPEARTKMLPSQTPFLERLVSSPKLTG